jgi:hypothetical protein
MRRPLLCAYEEWTDNKDQEWNRTLGNGTEMYWASGTGPRGLSRRPTSELVVAPAATAELMQHVLLPPSFR